MTHLGLVEYAGIKMSRDGIKQLMKLFTEFNSIYKTYSKACSSHFRISWLTNDKLMREYHDKKAGLCLEFMQTNFEITEQILITLKEWMEKLKEK